MDQIDNLKSICIIPARGGSKRIPRKNIKNFNHHPIISYPIKIALNSNLFSKVMVSTDDAEIADISRFYGAEVPFFRSEKNSDDYATTADVLKEVLKNYSKIGENYHMACCIYPAAVFTNEKNLIEAFQILNKAKADTVFSVFEMGSKLWRAYNLHGGKLNMIFPQFKNTRSQDLEKLYCDAGQFYFFNVSALLEKNNLITDNCIPIIYNELQVQDIDTEIDWQIAEIKYNLLNQK